jgi:ribosomal protein S18 acetylase RimI-like enzyme
MTSELAQAAAFEEALRDAVAERVVASPLGSAVFNDTLPLVWSLNTLRVERAGATAEEIAAEAERLQGEAELTHRRVVVLDEAEGRGLEDSFNAQGWKTDAYLFMVPRREPNRPVNTSSVAEVEREALAPIRESILREWLTEPSEDVVRQVREADRLTAAAGNARHFAAVVDGIPVSSTDLYSDGHTAQIEDVGTLPDHRGEGHASAVVMRALAEARAMGHEFIFLTADARDWPKELYRRLGFDGVGERYAYLRGPAEAG